jgi:RNA polymerase sigma-70 factor (ECF subfamily)
MSRTMLDNEAISASISDPSWFGALFDRHFDAVYSYARRRVGESAADEIAAQTFLIAFDRRAAYDISRVNAKPWLLGIATNLIHGQRRQEERQFRAYARAGVDTEGDPLDGLEARVDARRLRPQLAALLEALPKDEADPLLLFAWAELGYEEIATALEVPEGTVKSRLSRARSRIREQLRLPRTTGEETPNVNLEVENG